MPMVNPFGPNLESPVELSGGPTEKANNASQGKTYAEVIIISTGKFTPIPISPTPAASDGRMDQVGLRHSCRPL